MRTGCPAWMVLSAFICCGPSISQRGIWRAAAGVLESEMSVDVGSQDLGWGSRIRAGSEFSLGLPLLGEAEVGSLKAMGYPEGGTSVSHSGALRAYGRGTNRLSSVSGSP